MSRISYVHGIKNTSVSAPAKRYLNPAFFTEGELSLMLLLERLELLRDYYQHRNYFMGVDMVTNAISKGLHTATGIGYFGSIPSELNVVAQAILSSKRKINPASYIVAERTAKISGGFDPNSPLVDERDCLAEWQADRAAAISKYGGPRSIPSNVTNKINNDRALCEEYNNTIMQMNRYLGDSAHQLIYNYLTDASILRPERVAKIQDHRQVISRLAQLAGTSRENMESWCRNGIMRHNYKKGGEPLSPENSIIAAMQKSKKDGHIGDFGLSTLVAIISAVTAAIAATKALVDSFNEEKKLSLLQQAPGLTTDTFGLEYLSDFGLEETDPGGGNTPGGSDGEGSDQNNMIIGGLFLVGGLFLYNQNNS